MAPQLFKHKEFNFEKLGIGGLDIQFEQIFRRAFASRVFPPAVVERLGIRHVKVGVNDAFTALQLHIFVPTSCHGVPGRQACQGELLMHSACTAALQRGGECCGQGAVMRVNMGLSTGLGPRLVHIGVPNSCPGLPGLSWRIQAALWVHHSCIQVCPPTVVAQTNPNSVWQAL